MRPLRPTITKAIVGVDPRAAVKVDLASGAGTMTSDAPTARIAEAIQAEGYEAKPE